MSFLSTTVLAFSMSADAFAASISKGVKINRPTLGQAARIGLVFGAVETITPVIGWILGLAASSLITSLDHWIAFFILGSIGAKMIYEGLKPFQAADIDQPKSHGFGMLVMTAIGTSIDAMAVGVTLAFLDINIWVAALAIGSATFLMSTIGIMAGAILSMKAGKYAEIMGGIGLVLIGSHILASHLGLL